LGFSSGDVCVAPCATETGGSSSSRDRVASDKGDAAAAAAAKEEGHDRGGDDSSRGGDDSSRGGDDSSRGEEAASSSPGPLGLGATTGGVLVFFVDVRRASSGTSTPSSLAKRADWRRCEDRRASTRRAMASDDVFRSCWAALSASLFVSLLSEGASRDLVSKGTSRAGPE